MNEKNLHWIHHVHYFCWSTKLKFLWENRTSFEPIACTPPVRKQLHPATMPLPICAHCLFIDIQSIDRNQPTLPQLCPLAHKRHCFVSLLEPAAYFSMLLASTCRQCINILHLLLLSYSSFSFVCRLEVHARLFELGENLSSFLHMEFYSYPINLHGFETGGLVPCSGRVTLTTNCLHLKIIHDNFVLSQKLAHCIL